MGRIAPCTTGTSPLARTHGDSGLPGVPGMIPRNRHIIRLGAFTLVEVLVAISILSILFAILVPALNSGRDAARSLKCRAQYREVAFSFVDFVSRSSHHGDGEQWGDSIVKIEDFQESVYRVHEFWDGPATLERVAYQPGKQPLMCPAGPDLLDRRAEMPCTAGAVGPAPNVSSGLNKRLDSKTRYVNGSPFPQKVYLNEKVLMYPDVPLVLDVDGKKAVANGVGPYFTAPPLPNDGPPDIYSNGLSWFPSFRHRGQINVAFIGGHVLSSRSPLTEPWWRWSFQPD